MAKQPAKIFLYLNKNNIAHSLTHANEVSELVRDAEDEGVEPPYMVIKAMILDQIVDLLNNTGMVRNKTKLGKLLINREKRMSTGLSDGIAFPHVRTDDVKGFAMAVIIPEEPIPYGTVDDSLVSIIIGMVSPTYDDDLHRRIYQKLAELFQYHDFLEKLRYSQSADEVMFIFRSED